MDSKANKIKILVVDDEESICKALRRSLRDERYEVLLANSPAEGLGVLSTNDINIVISDHLMPEMTGLQFLKIVRNRFPHIVRIMLTGHADMQTAIDTINQGEIFRFLTKPWENEELRFMIELAAQQYESQLEARRAGAAARCAQLAGELRKPSNEKTPVLILPFASVV